MKVKIPRKLGFLFRPARYKVARGGRGSAKSWSFGRALLVMGSERPLRILCAREVQTSIRQSVHQLLKDQIKLLGLDSFYDVKEHAIYGVNGTLFTFTGLSDLTVDTIKSFEGYDICWVEEGQAISDRSWKILIPTIRKARSEIWISYNPDLETDPTHQRFTINPPPGTVNVEMNWRDNPWFNEILEAERQHCLKTDSESYDNIWEGRCRPAVEGAIYAKQVVELETNRRICNVPHDPMLKVHLVLDLGWDDSLATSLIQRHLSEIRFIEYVELSHTTWPEWSTYMRSRPYNWGKVWLPHDGYAKSLNSGGNSAYDILTDLSWNVPAREEITEVSIEEGIKLTRLKFGQMYFDAGKCNAKQAPEDNGLVKHTDLSHRLIECIKRYRRHINRQTSTTGAPVKDKHAHGADNIRYVALNADSMTNEDEVYEYHTGADDYSSAGAQGWMGN